MILLFIAISLLLVVTLILFYFPWREETKIDQDCLNRMLYQARLQELDDENSDSRRSLIVDLQRTLLADSREATLVTRQPLSCWVLLPGALSLMLISLGIFFHVSDFGQLMRWQSAQRQLPVLMEQIKDPGARQLQMNDIAELRLGLRSHLQEHPDDRAGWQMLGRIGLVLNDRETAIGAFAKAYELAKDNLDMTCDYANVLIRLGDKSQTRMGELLLRELNLRHPKNLRVLELLAINALRNEAYPEAKAFLQAMLAQLPPNDSRRKAIETDIKMIEERSQHPGF